VIDPEKLAEDGGQFITGDMPGTDENDTVIIGYPAKPSVENSTQHSCFICGTQVWVSPESMNTVLDSVNRNGGKLRVVCVSCVPKDVSAQMFISDHQKAEMKRLGVDIDEYAAERGMTTQELARISIARVRIIAELEKAGPENIKAALQRAAKEGFAKKPCEDGKGGFQPERISSLFMALHMLGNYQKGAIINGRRVKKVHTEPGDRTPEGTEGTVLGSTGLPNMEAVIIEDQAVIFGYLIAFDDEEVPVFTTNLKVEEV
jgi:hypothetical protein